MNKLSRAAHEEMGDAGRAKEKVRKAGYQGKVDDMRIKADEMLGSKPRYIKEQERKMTRDDYKEKAESLRANADRKKAESMRADEYKKGGKVKADCYAMGGVGKIRHCEATKSGKPIALPKMSRAGRGI